MNLACQVPAERKYAHVLPLTVRDGTIRVSYGLQVAGVVSVLGFVHSGPRLGVASGTLIMARGPA